MHCDDDVCVLWCTFALACEEYLCASKEVNHGELEAVVLEGGRVDRSSA